MAGNQSHTCGLEQFVVRGLVAALRCHCCDRFGWRGRGRNPSRFARSFIARQRGPSSRSCKWQRGTPSGEEHPKAVPRLAPCAAIRRRSSPCERSSLRGEAGLVTPGFLRFLQLRRTAALTGCQRRMTLKRSTRPLQRLGERPDRVSEKTRRRHAGELRGGRRVTAAGRGMTGAAPEVGANVASGQSYDTVVSLSQEV